MSAALDRQQLVDGMRFRTRTDVPWRDVPERYGPWARVYEPRASIEAVPPSYIWVAPLLTPIPADCTFK
ncbi:transposase [Streptomyces sp. NPDC050255]|uniref:transposase n=2 Tax=unclassified Streptomyces TaxID=2593676 RepID=UPI0037A60FE6